jgi:hypothetical protein
MRSAGLHRFNTEGRHLARWDRDPCSAQTEGAGMKLTRVGETA